MGTTTGDGKAPAAAPSSSPARSSVGQNGAAAQAAPVLIPPLTSPRAAEPGHRSLAVIAGTRASSNVGFLPPPLLLHPHPSWVVLSLHQQHRFGALRHASSTARHQRHPKTHPRQGEHLPRRSLADLPAAAWTLPGSKNPPAAAKPPPAHGQRRSEDVGIILL